MLLTTDMDFGTITDEEGKIVPLTISNFSTYIRSNNQNVRKEAFLKLYSEIKHYENTFNTYGITHVILYKNSKLNIFLSRSDRYKELYSDKKFVIYERD